MKYRSLTSVGWVMVATILATGLGIRIFRDHSGMDEGYSFVGQSASHDFGDRSANDILRHTFVLRNPLNCSCTIDRVVATCSCLVAGEKEDLIGRRIPPRGSNEVPIIFPLAGRAGKVQGAIALSVNPDSRPASTSNRNAPLSMDRTIFSFFAWVHPDLDSVPKEVVFGLVDSDEPVASVNVRLRLARPEVSWRFSRVTDNLFRVNLISANTPEVSIDSAIARDRLPGPVKAIAEFIVENSGQDKFFLPISAELANSLTVEPPFLSFPKAQSSKTLTVSGPSPFCIAELSINGSKQILTEGNFQRSCELPILLPESVSGEGVVELRAEFADSKKSVVRKIHFYKLGED